MKRENTVSKKKILIPIALYFAAFIVMMIIGTYRDLEISKSMFNYSNGFARFMADYGMIPSKITRLLAYSVLIAAYHKTDDVLDILQSFFPFVSKFRDNKPVKGLIFVLLHIMYAMFCWGAFAGSNELLDYILGSAAGGNIQDLMVAHKVPYVFAVIVWTIVRIALAALTVFLFHKLGKEKLRALEFMAIAGLLVYEGSDVINHIKTHFHRVRFREMVAYSHSLIDANGMTSIGDNDMPKTWVEDSFYDAYTPWYKIGADYGIYSNSNAFPSGHTAAAAFSMMLPMLVLKAKKAEKLYIPAFVISFAYTLLVGFMRILRGAHYLTDIAAAALIMLAMILLIVGILTKLERHSNKKMKRILRLRKREEEKAKSEKE